MKTKTPAPKKNSITEETINHLLHECFCHGVLDDMGVPARHPVNGHRLTVYGRLVIVKRWVDRVRSITFAEASLWANRKHVTPRANEQPPKNTQKKGSGRSHG